MALLTNFGKHLSTRAFWKVGSATNLWACVFFLHTRQQAHSQVPPARRGNWPPSASPGVVHRHPLVVAVGGGGGVVQVGAPEASGVHAGALRPDGEGGVVARPEEAAALQLCEGWAWGGGLI